MKIQIAQVTTAPARFSENYQQIAAAVEQAKLAEADLIVFPELAVCGYAHLDLIYKQHFRSQAAATLAKIAGLSDGIAIIVGCPRLEDGEVYNSAFVFDDGQQIAVIDKQLLPEYDIFFETRYFKRGKPQPQLVRIANQLVGIGICEDLWDTTPQGSVYQQLLDLGAEVLINISASPYSQGKIKVREHLVSRLLGGRSETTFVYCNLVGSFDCYEGQVIFDGSSFAYQSGQFYYLPTFSEASVSFDLLAPRKPADYQFARQNTAEVEAALILGIQSYFKASKLSKAIIGISGGIDSAVVATLAVKALGKENVLGVTLPNQAITSSATISDAKSLCKNLDIELREVPIGPQYKAWAESFPGILEAGDLTRQNVQARLRGLTLMSIANNQPGSIVLTTGNKTELALGYCTLYGDMSGGLAPISDLHKNEVYQLATKLNKDSELIPLSVISRAPTAELAPDQKDSDNLPADYDILSPLVQELIEADYNLQELHEKYSEGVVTETIKLIKLAEHKRRQAAPGIRVSLKSFGSGRRFPISY